MAFRLVVETQGRRGRSIEVRSSVARIGRALGNEVRIPSAQVSRRHCELREKKGLVTVEDLKSVNGTFLNGDLITGVAVVRPGDRVDVGPITFVVEYELSPRTRERLRSMGHEVEDEEPIEVIAADDEDDEETEERPKPNARPALVKPEEEPAEEEEEAPLTSLMDLDDVSWKPPEKGDLHDLLSGLDRGEESMMPRKRPAPRTKQKPEGADPEGRPGPKGGGGKRQPEPEG